MEIPDHGHGQHEQSGVQHGVGHRKADERSDEVDAVACSLGVSGEESAVESPKHVDGPALENRSKETGYSPADLKSSDEI